MVDVIKDVLKKCSFLVFFVRKVRCLIQNLSEKSYKNRINKFLKSDIIVHLMFNDKFIKPFVDFINENFDQNKHIILCKRWFDFPFPNGKNVFEIKSYKFINFQNVKKIICHSLFDNEVVELLYQNKELLIKANWAMWGGDLYDANRDEKNDYVRSHFPVYIGACDKEIVRSKYNSQANVIDAGGYIFPIKKKMLDDALMKESNKDSIYIQINNSADESTIEILYKLEKFKDNNILIRTILSYGNLEFRDEIIDVGRKLFGKKFEYLDVYLSPEEYAKYISKNDILILNQKRQQGVGNIKAFLYLGKKVFIRQDVSTYTFFREMGIEIFNTMELERLCFTDFVKNKTAEINKAKIMKFFDAEYLAKSWKCVFD